MSDTARACPNCDATMSPHDVRNLHIDICGSCGGVWFDAGEFGRISRLGSRAVDAVVAEEPPDLTPVAKPEAVQHCPVDGTALDHYQFAGSSTVMLAGCSTCAGVFLSRDALMNLDSRDRQLERRDGQHLSEAEAASVAQLQGQEMYDTFHSEMAVYNWDQLMTPVMFT